MALIVSMRNISPIGSLTIVTLLLLGSCSPISQKAITKQLRETEDTFQDHIGFMLYDLEKSKPIVAYKASKYFTPASNTKIATLHACLRVLGDSIPALIYTRRNDSLFFKGTGDPAFLNRNNFDNQRVFNFLKTDSAQVFFYSFNFFTSHFGPGWSWEDYNYVFSAERCYFPVYGNVIDLQERRELIPSTLPSNFSESIEINDSLENSKAIRSIGSNKIEYYPGREGGLKKLTIPFHVDSSLLIRLLEDTLKRDVTMTHTFPPGNADTLYSLPVDSLYKVMMQQSDNFIAEQLLLVCSSVLSDSLKPEVPIRYVTQNYLSDLPDKLVWVDGSGLSRYNLFTPRAVVKLWEKIYQLVPRDRLWKILAIGGKPGTIRNYFKSDTPYIFGKTGTLSNIHCLSGFMVTKSNKTLIFSFMNTNFTTPVRDVRKKMEDILKTIQENY